MSKSWPDAAKFRQMIQHPRIAFKDRRLQGLRFEIEPNTGLPRPWSGSFAVVFKAEDPNGGGNLAVRIFVKNSPDRHQRYHLISEYLREHRPKSLVEFEYREDEVLAPDGKRYPLVIMDWVEGDTIFRWAERVCSQGDDKRLSLLFDRWLSVVRGLRDCQVCHGDLQHGNVLVTPDDCIWLVDYDGVAVPRMFGRPNFETGLSPYQHPKRDGRTALALHLDNFGALLIALALRALAVRPKLWDEYVIQRGAESLLFAPEDISAPKRSKLFRSLEELNDELVDVLLRVVRRCLEGPLDKIPSLDEAIASPSDRPSEERATAKEHVRAQSADKERATASTAAQDAAQTTNQSAPGSRSGRTGRRESATGQGNRRPEDRGVLQELERLIRQAEELVIWQLETEIVQTASHCLSHGHPYADRIALAQKRLSVYEEFVAACHHGIEGEISKAWQGMARLHIDHWADAHQAARAITATYRARISQVINELQSAPLSAAFDERLLAVWNDAACEEWDYVADWLPVVEQARTRQEQLPEIVNAVTSEDQVELAWYLSDSVWNEYAFPENWAPVIGDARRSLDAVWGMIETIENDDQNCFFRRLEPTLLHRFREWFVDYADRIEWLIDAAVRPCASNGLQLPIAYLGIVPSKSSERPQYLVRWQWPDTRLSDRCLLTLCPKLPGPADRPQDVEIWHSWEIDRTTWEQNGSQHLIFADAEYVGGYAVVWAALELGWTTDFSHPLVLGQLAAASKPGLLPGLLRRAGGLLPRKREVAAETGGDPEPIPEANSEESIEP